MKRLQPTCSDVQSVECSVAATTHIHCVQSSSVCKPYPPVRLLHDRNSDFTSAGHLQSNDLPLVGMEHQPATSSQMEAMALVSIVLNNPVCSILRKLCEALDRHVKCLPIVRRTVGYTYLAQQFFILCCQHTIHRRGKHELRHNNIPLNL